MPSRYTSKTVMLSARTRAGLWEIRHSATRRVHTRRPCARSRALVKRSVCRSGGTGRRVGLKIRWTLRPWGFDSLLRHHAFPYPPWAGPAGAGELRGSLPPLPARSVPRARRSKTPPGIAAGLRCRPLRFPPAPKAGRDCGTGTMRPCPWMPGAKRACPCARPRNRLLETSMHSSRGHVGQPGPPRAPAHGRSFKVSMAPRASPERRGSAAEPPRGRAPMAPPAGAAFSAPAPYHPG